MTEIGTANFILRGSRADFCCRNPPHVSILNSPSTSWRSSIFSRGSLFPSWPCDPAGKQQTRAYSIASAPRGNQFDVCVNRVEGGFFSNLLCDLEVGQSIQFHGPHGLFLLRAPLTDSILIATGTGIAPMRGFVEHLFPENGEDRSQGRKIWLVYGTRYETELYYEDYFEKVAASQAKFLLPQNAEPSAGRMGGRARLRAGIGAADRR